MVFNHSESSFTLLHSLSSIEPRPFRRPLCTNQEICRKDELKKCCQDHNGKCTSHLNWTESGLNSAAVNTAYDGTVEGQQLDMLFRLTVHLLLVGTLLHGSDSSCPHWIKSSGVSIKQLYFCGMNRLTSPWICYSHLQQAMYKSMPWWARERAVIFTLFPS